jgi:hypothetical protein
MSAVFKFISRRELKAAKREFVRKQREKTVTALRSKNGYAAKSSHGEIA